MPVGDKAERLPLHCRACVWTDIISTWKQKITAKVRFIRVPKIYFNPMLKQDFGWPNLTEIKALQQESICDAETCVLGFDVERKIWTNKPTVRGFLT
jgi:hypothetical protein